MRFVPLDNGRLKQLHQLQVYFGGAEANVALLLSKLGHDVSFLSALPANDIGEAAISHLKKEGVDTTYIFRGGDRLGSYYYEEGYSVRLAKVIYDRKHSSVHQLSNIHVDWGTIFKGVHILHITGITPALSEPLKLFTLEALSKAKEFGVQVSFDFNYRSKLWSIDEAKETFLEILPYVDICFAGYRDFTQILGYEGSHQFNEDWLEEYYKFVSKRYKIKYLVCTNRIVHSPHENELQGFIYSSGVFCKTDPVSFHILDRIGAGDAFAAGIVHGIISKLPLQDTIIFGIASSVLKHTTYGDYSTFTEEEIQNVTGNTQGDVNR